jgi:hypothetical protein
VNNYTRTPVMVFGKRPLQRLIEFCDIDWGGAIFITEYAFGWDKDKYYWIIKSNGNNFMSVQCDKDYTYSGWGYIRKGKDGSIIISQKIPKEVEQKLREQTAERIKKDLVSDLLFSGQAV